MRTSGTENGPRRARQAMRSRCPALLAILLLAAAPFSAAYASAGDDRPFGRFGLALKTGAAAGPMGVQLAWNINRHIQLCAGGGGTADYLSLLDRSRTDSYFAMGKYYLDHLYFETGYARKTTKAEFINGDDAQSTYRTEQAVPVHVGYEFGHRQGFYFSTSAGYFYVIGDGGVIVSPRNDADGSSSARSAKSGFTAGLSVGYYLW
jgi:hypothetical protein